jgi:hypothetical protein
MKVPDKTSASIWLVMRVIACVASISIFVLCIYLFVFHAVSDYYHPNEPAHIFWLFCIPLIAAAAYLLFVGVFGRLRPATVADWLRGVSLSVVVFAVLWFVAPAIYRHAS